MTRDEIRLERARLQDLLDRYEAGKATHYDEDHTGQLRHDTTKERVASLRVRIAELDQKLSEDWRDA